MATEIANQYFSEIAVAHGAVLRALDKENGPTRFTESSYGFLRTEPYSKEIHPDMRPMIDPLDGERYIKHTIDWLIKKVSGSRMSSAC